VLDSIGNSDFYIKKILATKYSVQRRGSLFGNIPHSHRFEKSVHLAAGSSEQGNEVVRAFFFNEGGFQTAVDSNAGVGAAHWPCFDDHYIAFIG
jgi:hypothetical protein